VSGSRPSSELDHLTCPAISITEGRCPGEHSVRTTQPSYSGQFPRALSVSVGKVRFANLVLLCATLLVCASGRAQTPVAVVTDQTALSLSNHFGVPFGGVVDQSGDYAFLGNGATAAFYRHAGSSTERVLQVGDPMPGITGSQVVFFQQGGGINSSGHVVFAVRFSLNDGSTHTALETYDGTTLHTVVLSTDIAPNTGGKTYGPQIFPIGIDDNGDVAFVASLTPFGTGTGVIQRTLFIVPSGGSAVRVVGEGDAVAAPAGTISTIRTPNAINALGQVLIHCRIQQTGGGSPNALFVGSATGGLQKVVAGGDSAPGGGNFSGIGGTSAFLNNSGKVAFSAVVSSSIETWLWTAPSSLTLVAASGSAAPASVPGGGTLGGPFPQGIDDGADILINSVITGGTTTGALLRYHTASATTPDLVADNGETVSGKTFQFVYFASMANNGMTGFAVQLSAGGLAIYTQSGTGTPALVVADGQVTSLSGGGTFSLSHTFPVPGGGTPVFLPTATLLQTLNNGSVYFTSSVAGNASGAFYGEFLGSSGSITNLMSTADTLPAGARVSFFGGPDIVAAGHFVGFTAQQAGGLISVFVTDRTSSTTTKIGSEGDPAPSGLAGTLGNGVGLTEMFVNSSGQVVFGASLKGAGAGQGIFTGSPSNALAKVVATGDSASANSIFTFAQPTFSLAPSMLNDSGQAAFLASTSNSSGIFLFTPGAGGGITKIVAVGDTAPDGSTFTLLADNSSQGGPVVINAGGQIAFAADTSTGSGIFVGSAGNTVQKVVATGDSLAGGTVTGLFGLSSFNNGGTLVFAGSVTIPPATTQTNGLFEGIASGAVSTLVLDGTTAPGTGGGTFFTQLFGVFPSGAVQINDEGDLAFRSGVSGGTSNSGYFRLLQSDHTLRAIVLQGQAVPGGLGTFDLIPAPTYQGGGFALGPDGAMVFSNNFVTGASVTDRGDFGVTAGGTIFKIISAGDAVPGTGGGLLSIATPSFSSDGNGGFAAFVEASGGTAREVVLWTNAGGPAVPTVFIDAPTSGATVQGTVTVSGWAIDNSSTEGTAISSVQVKVDGTVVGTATYGSSRPDVCAVYPGRPSCPNVGYSFSLNTSSLSPGSHTITVTATDSDGTPDAGSSSVTVTVTAGPTLPSVWIDAPTPGSTVSGTVTVAGWAIDNTSAVGTAINSVQVKVDGSVVGTATYGLSRPDVCAAFPGRPGCPNVGYSFSLNTSSLSPGSHTITVTAADSDTTPDASSSSVTVTVQATPPTVYIDGPTAGSIVSGTVTVVGWAIDNTSAVGTAFSSLQVKVDGTVVGFATYGVSRPDVCAVYPGRPSCPNVGYSFSLNTSALSVGSHTITVTATDSDGIPDSGSSSVTVTVQATPPTVYIDGPTAGSIVSGTVTVVGWAIDNTSAVGTAINNVQVKVDGTVVGTAIYGSSRPDVCAVYPGRPGCPNVGYSFSLNTSGLSAGAHTITVTATDSDGTPDSGSASVSVTK